MFLDRVKTIDNLNGNNFLGSVEPFDKWLDFPASAISHHGQTCCEAAREWIFAMDFSLLNGEAALTGPRWIRQKFNWGPTKYPIYWCEAVRQKTLDCGALATLSREVFAARGVKSFPVQLVQQFSRHATSQWMKKWDEDETSTHWINDDLIYHEACAVLVRGNEMRIWDPSAAWWVNPNHSGGYGSLIALRLFVDYRSSNAVSFNWGTHRIVPNQWQKINESPGESGEGVDPKAEFTLVG